MKIRLAHPAAQWCFLVVVILLAGTLAFLGGKSGLAETWASSSQPDNWRRAAELERDPRAAGGRYQAAPIRIAAVHGRLH